MLVVLCPLHCELVRSMHEATTRISLIISAATLLLVSSTSTTNCLVVSANWLAATFASTIDHSTVLISLGGSMLVRR